jgi:large repetitive protein
MKHRFSSIAATLAALLALSALNNELTAQTPADQPVLWASITEFCEGDFVEVQLVIESGNLNDSENWAWYAGACGTPGTFINFGEVVSWPIGETTTFFAFGTGGPGNLEDGPCASITVSAIGPLTAQAGADQVICATSTVLAAAPPPAGTGQWSVELGVAVIADPSSPTSAVTGLIPGEEAILRWTVSSDGICEEAFDEVAIFSVLPPEAPDAGPDQVQCNAASTFVSATPDITGLWTVTSGTASIDNPTSPNTIVSVPVGTTAVLRWTIDDGVCPPAFDELAITNETPLAPADAGPDQVICAASTVLAAAPPPAGTGQWSVELGVAVIADPSSPTSAVTGLIPGEEAILRWTVSSDGICEEAFDEVAIFSVLPPEAPDAGPDQVQCNAASTFVSATPDITGLWTVTSGTASIDNPTSPNTVVSVPVGTTAVLRWTIDNGVCPPAFDELAITNEAPLDPADAGPDQVICAASTVLAAAPPPAGTGQWSVELGVAVIADPSSPTSAVTGLIPGEEAILRWTVSSDGICEEAFDEVAIFSVLPPEAPDAGPDQVQCNAASTFVSATPDITGLWTVTSGTALIDNPTSPNTIVSVPVGTTAVLRWTIDDGVCPPAFDELAITNEAPLDPADAGPDQVICAASTVLAAAPPPAGTGQWSVELGVAVIADPSSPTSAVTGLIPGEEAILRWTVSSDGICEEAFDEVAIFSVLPPEAPDAGPDQVQCNAASTFVSATPDITGLWTVTSGTASIDNPTSPNTVVSVPVGTTAVLRWTIDDGVCPSAFDELAITNEAPLDPADAGPDQVICAASTVLAAAPPPAGTGQWSVELGVAVIADPSSPTSPVTGLIPGEEAILRWTVSSDGICEEAFDEVAIFSVLPPEAPDAGPDQVQCNAASTFVSATPDITGLWTVTSGTASIDNPTSPNTVVSVPVGTTAVLRWTIDDGVCPPAFDELAITNETPLAPADAGPDQVICAASTVLAAAPPPAGTGQWSVELGVAVIADPSSPTSAVTGLIPGEAGYPALDGQQRWHLRRGLRRSRHLLRAPARGPRCRAGPGAVQRRLDFRLRHPGHHGLVDSDLRDGVHRQPHLAQYRRQRARGHYGGAALDDRRRRLPARFRRIDDYQ